MCAKKEGGEKPHPTLETLLNAWLQSFGAAASNGVGLKKTHSLKTNEN